MAETLDWGRDNISPKRTAPTTIEELDREMMAEKISKEYLEALKVTWKDETQERASLISKLSKDDAVRALVDVNILTQTERTSLINWFDSHQVKIALILAWWRFLSSNETQLLIEKLPSSAAMNTLSVLGGFNENRRLSESDLAAISDKIPAEDLRISIPKWIPVSIRMRLLSRVLPQDIPMILRTQWDLTQEERLLVINRITSEGAIIALFSKLMNSQIEEQAILSKVIPKDLCLLLHEPSLLSSPIREKLLEKGLPDEFVISQLYMSSTENGNTWFRLTTAERIILVSRVKSQDAYTAIRFDTWSWDQELRNMLFQRLDKKLASALLKDSILPAPFKPLSKDERTFLSKEKLY